MPPQRTANQWRAHRLPPRLISTGATHTSSPPTILHREPPVTAQRPKLLDQVRKAIRMRHYSLRTEDTYIHWVKRFIFFHGKRHPREMGEKEIGQFLSALAVDRRVSASTQNQALNAILFLYRYVLDLNPGWIDNVVRAKQPQRLPGVLRKHEVKALCWTRWREFTGSWATSCMGLVFDCWSVSVCG